MISDGWVERRQARRGLADRIESQVPGFTWDYQDGDRAESWPPFGGACPWQGDGYYQGKPCYLRFRHNQASMTVYADEAREVELLAAVIWPYFPAGHPDAHEHAGDLADDQIAPFVQALIAELAPVSDDNPSSATILRRAVEEMMAAVAEGGPDGQRTP